MRALRAVFIYAVLTAALTWPLLRQIHFIDPGDSAFFAWEIAWELHALGSDPRELPHGNIFHPLRYALGMDEPILGTTLLALPLRPFVAEPIVLFNLVRLFTFTLTAFTAYLLARELGCGEPAALLGGALFAFSPVRTDQIAHLSTLGTQWLPLVFLFLVRVGRRGRASDGVWAAVFFVLSAYACGYHGIIAIAVLPAFALPLFWRRPLPWRAVALGLAVAAIGLLPLYALHRAALGPLGYVRGLSETRLYSAGLESFLAASPWNHVWSEATAPFRAVGVNNLFVGLGPPLLALAGLWRVRGMGRRPSREAWALVLLIVAAAAVALGPEVNAFGRTLGRGPFALLRDAIPLFQNIRVPARAGVFIALAMAMLAAKGFARLALRAPAALAVAAAVIAETLIAPIPAPEWTLAVDARREPPPVYRWLAAQAGGFAIVELPMLDTRSFTRARFHESIYMVHSRHHWKRLVNGYAGVEPATYLAFREKARRFPSGESIDAFRAADVRYVVLHRRAFGPNQRSRLERDLPRFEDGPLRRVAEFGDDVVFALGQDRGLGTMIPEEAPVPLALTSPAFAHMGEIPSRHTCEGEDTSPALQWSGVPEGTKSLALIVDDPDAPDPAAPKLTWVHWVVYDIAAAEGGLAEGSGKPPPGAREGVNDWKRTGYGGPCPPIGRHRYFHKLYALDAVLGDLRTPTKAALEKAMKGHVLAEAQLMGTYQKKK